METAEERLDNLQARFKDITKRMKRAFGKNGVEYLRLLRERAAIKEEASEVAKELRKEQNPTGYRKAAKF